MSSQLAGQTHPASPRPKIAGTLDDSLAPVPSVPPAPAPSSPRARNVMLGNRSESSPEVALRSALHKRGLRFRKHVAPVQGLRCKPDIVFTRRRIAVFVDGCFWHRCPDHGSKPKANGEWWRRKLDANVARDRRNDAALIEAGWTVLRFWTHEPLEAMVAQIIQATESTSTSDPTG